MITNTIQLGEGEHIAHVTHRHWFHLAVVGFIDAILFLCTVIAAGVGGAAFSTIVAGAALGKSVALGLFFVSCVGLFLWMHFFTEWTDTWLDTWIITNKRIIDVEQRAFFSREVSIIPLERVQDVTSSVHGIIATWLDFGDVQMHTASDDDNFVMRQVPHPDVLKERLMRALEEYKRSK